MNKHEDDPQLKQLRILRGATDNAEKIAELEIAIMLRECELEDKPADIYYIDFKARKLIRVA